ncbi:hypothetical protein RCL1_007979 [Eukaryota sp. TZLM3-RCL]
MFMVQSKGDNLELSDDQSEVTALYEGYRSKFIAIDLQKGKVVLTMKETHVNGWFNTSIGLFDQEECQEDQCLDSFVGINPFHMRTYFFTHGIEEVIAPKMVIGDFLIVEANSSHITFLLPKNNWSRTIEKIKGQVFGLVLYNSQECWQIS